MVDIYAFLSTIRHTKGSDIGQLSEQRHTPRPFANFLGLKQSLDLLRRASFDAPQWDVLLSRQPGFSSAGSTPRPT